jgi:aryl-alcohol dehydrogenase-like predicted oxidoreductase
MKEISQTRSMPLVLGTVQLGIPYGIANKAGQPNEKLATEIVREAWNNGIQQFDTAQGYGESEKVLGKVFCEAGITHEVKVISKFDPNLDHLNHAALSEALDGSLYRLGLKQLACMMLHREEYLSLWKKGLGESLHHFVQSGKIRSTGISVSTPEKAIQALNTNGIDLIQVPGNIMDRKFERAGIFELAQMNKKQIHVRSVFLQGLILMNPQDLPTPMAYAIPFLEKAKSLCLEMKLTPQELALGYFKSIGPEVSLVFGAETVKQVQENVRNWRKTVPPFLNHRIEEMFSQVPDAVVNPTLWPKS